MKSIQLERVWLKGNSELDEKWVQQRIADDPSILGLGKLFLKDKERLQHRAGRLDLLLQDVDTDRRYEVEIQLGRADEVHIIRTIEYWDIERKRFPQYDHCAVIVAEDITSRFLNVISLFNSSIPLIAIQMSAFRFENQVGLVFITVLDELVRGLVDEDEEVQQGATRFDWETQGSKETVSMVDRLLETVKHLDGDLELKYNKFYIGLAKDGVPNNFVIFRPKKSHLRLEPRLKPSPEVEKTLEDAGLDAMEYDKRWGRYRIRLTQSDLNKHKDLINDLLKRAYENTAL